jgi:hypothetical protein
VARVCFLGTRGAGSLVARLLLTNRALIRLERRNKQAVLFLGFPHEVDK